MHTMCFVFTVFQFFQFKVWGTKRVWYYPLTLLVISLRYTMVFGGSILTKVTIANRTLLSPETLLWKHHRDALSESVLSHYDKSCEKLIYKESSFLSIDSQAFVHNCLALLALHLGAVVSLAMAMSYHITAPLLTEKWKAERKWKEPVSSFPFKDIAPVTFFHLPPTLGDSCNK